MQKFDTKQSAKSLWLLAFYILEIVIKKMLKNENMDVELTAI